MTDSSNVFINNFDNKPEFLTLIKSIIKKDDANRLLAVLNNLSQDATTLNTTDKDKCNEIESKLFGFEHTVLGYEDLLHLFTWNYYDVMPGRAVEYLNNRIIGPYRSVHNLSLLFELIIATPEICPTILSDINETWIFSLDLLIIEIIRPANKMP
ncbi:hypothetical protein Smp_133030 [Schistosoma mansoni]|uniref:hypothetical protein n=1 Tax=Schistosoma mansoni TaxID=6183 RepID=UPI0001A62FD4|nr:hypothetical protein Smp_133030 [Schistosoma mansoni]|eukprot:XP_018647993.1 hypothetical protein Smp_133030 [Schistosoma mansoni]